MTTEQNTFEMVLVDFVSGFPDLQAELQPFIDQYRVDGDLEKVVAIIIKRVNQLNNMLEIQCAVADELQQLQEQINSN